MRRMPPYSVVMATADQRPMRADARENRDRLLRAAGERFALDGPDVPLEAIARSAGVGIGTLYRHFPDRAALIEAVYRSEVDQLCAAGPVLLSQRPAADALAEWMERFVTYAARKRALLAVLRSTTGAQSDVSPSARERLLAAIGEILQAGIDAGELRPDVDSQDVFASMNAVWLISGGGEDWAAQTERVLRLLMDGLRFGAAAGGG